MQILDAEGSINHWQAPVLESSPHTGKHFHRKLAGLSSRGPWLASNCNNKHFPHNT